MFTEQPRRRFLGKMLAGSSLAAVTHLLVRAQPHGSKPAETASASPRSGGGAQPYATAFTDRISKPSGLASRPLLDWFYSPASQHFHWRYAARNDVAQVLLTRDETVPRAQKLWYLRTSS